MSIDIDKKVQAAKDAIDAVFSDTTVLATHIREALDEVLVHLGETIDAIDADIEEDDEWPGDGEIVDIADRF